MTEPSESVPADHISVCICTYRRQRLLGQLLDALRAQQTAGRFSYSIVVADNDGQRSAEQVVRDYAESCILTVHYCVEPRQNIALARNRAVHAATGTYIAFVDDDELPGSDWLLTLFEACRRFDSSGALGPVKPYFEQPPPKWLIDGRFYDRATYPTGTWIDWRKGRTGNVLLRRSLFEGDENPFRPEFLSGEDQDFFRRMIEKGNRFVWCDEAVAHEVVPPVRWTRGFMLRRALLRGGISPLEDDFGYRQVMKSIVAIPAYTAALPFALVLGQHRFMACAIRLFEHAGRLLALVGIRPIKESYVTE